MSSRGSSRSCDSYTPVTPRYSPVDNDMYKTNVSKIDLDKVEAKINELHKTNSKITTRIEQLEKEIEIYDKCITTSLAEQRNRVSANTHNVQKLIEKMKLKKDVTIELLKRKKEKQHAIRHNKTLKLVEKKIYITGLLRAMNNARSNNSRGEVSRVPSCTVVDDLGTRVCKLMLKSIKHKKRVEKRRIEVDRLNIEKMLLLKTSEEHGRVKVKIGVAKRLQKKAEKKVSNIDYEMDVLNVKRNIASSSSMERERFGVELESDSD